MSEKPGTRPRLVPYRPSALNKRPINFLWCRTLQRDPKSKPLAHRPNACFRAVHMAPWEPHPRPAAPRSPLCSDPKSTDFTNAAAMISNTRLEPLFNVSMSLHVDLNDHIKLPAGLTQPHDQPHSPPCQCCPRTLRLATPAAHAPPTRRLLTPPQPWLTRPTLHPCSQVITTNSSFGVVTALAFGIGIMVSAFSIGHVSGCHLNPAVTVSLLLSGNCGIGQVGARGKGT